MNRPCVISIVCRGPQPGLEADSPVTNYSAEYTDGPEFHAYRFPPFRPYDPGLPGWWSAQACAGAFTCTSQISQEDADDCAAALAYICAGTPPVPPIPPSNPPVGPELFPNQTQQASFTCPDGTLFYWTIPQGTIYSTSTALANAVALALAQQRAAKNRTCFSALTNQPCLELEYTDLVIVSGGMQPYTLSIVGGGLPPGLVLTDLGGNQAAITGTATLSGIYSVTIRATGITGGYADKDYTFSVIGILNPSPLSDGTVSIAYNEQLNVDGGGAPFTFSILSGTLPAGLTLSASGLISGPPTAAVTETLLIQFSDSAGASCRKEFTITINCMISTVSLPNGIDGTAYSQTLTVAGFVGAVTWSIISGALPSGLSLNASTGEISGNPGTVETQAFTVQAQQGEFLCEKALSIEIEAAGDCANWAATTWDYAPFTINVTHTESYSANGASFTGTFTAQQTGANPTQTQVQMIGTLVINTTALCCGRLSLIVTRGHGAPSISESIYAQIGYTYGGSEIWVLTNAESVTGDHDFQLPNTGGSDVTIYVTVAITARSDDFIEYSIDASGTFSVIPCP